MWPCGVLCSPKGTKYNEIFQLSQSLSPHLLLVSPYLTLSTIIKYSDCSPARENPGPASRDGQVGYLSPSRGTLIDAIVLFYVRFGADGNDSFSRSLG